MKILGIETSCDDTGVAIVDCPTEDPKKTPKVLCNLISSQHDFHKQYAGVVPEIAARKHVEAILPLLEEGLKEISLSIEAIDAIAVTTHPGLIGSLMVGVQCAKSIAYAYRKPLISVSHLKSHFYSLPMSTNISYPFIGLLVSGGHTLLTLCHSPLNIELLGTTVDDACGECFDKVAKFFDLGYPGGPMIEKLALQGDPHSYAFPKTQFKAGSRLDFSFSGLKTAVIHHHSKYLKKPYPKIEIPSVNLADLAASFQKTAFSYLYQQTLSAVEETGIKQIGVCGGVSANRYLRNLFLTPSSSKTTHLEVYFPDFSLCTDNAAMIAGLGYHYYQQGETVENILNLSPQAKSFKKEKVL